MTVLAATKEDMQCYEAVAISPAESGALPPLQAQRCPRWQIKDPRQPGGLVSVAVRVVRGVLPRQVNRARLPAAAAVSWQVAAHERCH